MKHPLHKHVGARMRAHTHPPPPMLKRNNWLWALHVQSYVIVSYLREESSFLYWTEHPPFGCVLSLKWIFRNLTSELQV